MSDGKRLTIILPSYKDPRIVDAIRSIRRFDDIDAVKILVIDGGSGDALLDQVRPLLSPADRLVSERDKGIFDALNKGLALVDTEFVGWLGSDDLFSGAVTASQICEALEGQDAFIGNVLIVKGARAKRMTLSWPTKLRLDRVGFHNPHYGTFGAAHAFKSVTFDPTDISADIAYFLELFDRFPRIATTNRVVTLQAEGGFSNTSLRKILQVNRRAFETYRHRSNAIVAAAAIVCKLAYKVAGVAWFKVFPLSWPDKYPALGDR